MKIPFTEEQIRLVQSVSDVDPRGNVNTQMLLKLVDDLENHIAMYGINDAGDGENETGRRCADLLAWLANHT